MFCDPILTKTNTGAYVINFLDKSNQFRAFTGAVNDSYHIIPDMGIYASEVRPKLLPFLNLSMETIYSDPSSYFQQKFTICTKDLSQQWTVQFSQSNPVSTLFCKLTDYL